MANWTFSRMLRESAAADVSRGPTACKTGVVETVSATLDAGDYDFVVWRQAFAVNHTRINTAD